jgi:hypothetical protein
MTNSDPSKITLENTSKLFEYEKISREIEDCSDIDVIKDMLRCYVKLYMKQQEVMTDIVKTI